jgi:hypothetical protein
MTSNRTDVAVVGGGIFGATAAVELALNGHHVELFERGQDLLLSASGINQYRLHRGYHYPRSSETATDCRDSEPAFRAEFPQAIGLSIRVRESLFDPIVLRRLVWERLRSAGVEVHLNANVEASDLEGFSQSVIATYADLNRLLPDAAVGRAYQFEVCEKPVVRLPDRYAGSSIVVMDGPFMCFDPLGDTGMFVLGNVVHAIHHVSIGPVPDVPPELQALLNRGIVPNPAITNIERFVDAGLEHFEAFDEAEHVGSMFTIRAVLPGVDVTDARPTLVREIDDRTISVFSGKIDTCIRAAKEVGRLIDARAERRKSEGTRLRKRTRTTNLGDDRGVA